jgi:UDPglucose 6-dehydrogenase
MSKSLSVVGLGKLGLCLASCFAEKGFDTIGIDVEERVVDCVNRGDAPFYEPGLDAMIAKHGGKKLCATTHHKEAIAKTDITFVLVATPSSPDGNFSNRFIEAALISLAIAFGECNKKYHLFVISSTVMPGSTQSNFIPILEKYSGRKLHQDFEVCYDPDFVALGNVINGFLYPDLVIIGETSKKAGEQTEALHREMCENEPVISHMSIISAELAKVSLNAYITVKISFANSIANLCESIPDADVDDITQAIGVDKRISPLYFQGGLSFGGTCFPRDTLAYISVAEKNGVQADIIRAVNQVNNYQDQHLMTVVLCELDKPENRNVGILGLAFKPNTPVIIESPALKLIQELLKHDIHIIAYDPLAIDITRSMLGSAIEYTDSVDDCLEKADVCVATLHSMEIKHAIENHEYTRPITLVDCWRMINPSELSEDVKYVPLGRKR